MPGLTPSQTIGPFFAEAFKWAIEMTAPPPGGVRVSGRVVDRDGNAVSDALIEIWQPSWAAQQVLAGWQRVATDAQGRFAFAMPAPDNGQVHVNVTIFARGLLRELFTRVYLHPSDDVAALDLPASVTAARRGTLAGKRTGESTYEWNVHLQGDGETVFFEI
jgi:protocatechuate 3,4-dioxygenase, alpha subunit